MNKFWIIAIDVFKKNVKSISFLIMILIPFIVLGIVYVAGIFAGQMNDVDIIGVYSDNPAITEYFTNQKTSDFEFKASESEKDAEKQLDKEEIDAFVIIKNDAGEMSGTLYSESGMGQTIDLTIQQLLSALQSSNRAQELGLTPEEVASLSEPANFTKQKVSFNDEGDMELGEDLSSVQYIVSFVGTIVLMVFIMTYAQIIAQEIASEKGTRIMEVILSSTRAQVHFFGKLCGVLLVAFAQMAAYVVIFGASYFWIRDMDIVKNVLNSISTNGIFGPFFVFTILYILLGIFIYAVLAALCGSLVNKAEDTAKAILPVTYLSMGGYMLGIILGATDPNNIIVRITSYIPFLSSYIMPIRLANENVSITGALISVLVLLISAIVLTMISAKMYKSNVLIYNDNGVFAAMKQSFKLMKNEKD